MEISRHNNCFNFIRIIAALQVFVGHASEHLNINLPNVVDKLISCFNGVPIFFVLSGFLIWNSIANTKGFKAYVTKRILRIYPELWGGVLINALLMAILYFEKIKLVPFLLFQVTQGTILQFWTPVCLRGYGTGTPNGSLWTIGVMVQSYLVIWGFYKFLHRKELKRWIGVLAIGVFFNCAVPVVVNRMFPEIIYKLYMQLFVSYIWLFLLGAFLCEYFDQMSHILVKYWGVWLLGVVTVSVTKFDIGRYGTMQGIFLALFVVGFGYRFTKIKIKRDISYGFYIYHMIVINAMIMIGIENRWYGLLAAGGVTAVMGYFSCVFMGKLNIKLRG